MISIPIKKINNIFSKPEPDFPETFFMSGKQKKNYFNKKNSWFQNVLK